MGNFTLYMWSNMVLDYRTRAILMNKKDKRKVKRRQGHLPSLLGKGAAHTDRTKYTRKRKNVRNQEDE